MKARIYREQAGLWVLNWRGTHLVVASHAAAIRLLDHLETREPAGARA